MTFRIFGALTGGTAIWSETRTVQIQNGIYNVLLGSVNPLDPGDLTKPVCYLEVELNAETLAPRARITSVPFAMRAQSLFGGRFEIDQRVCEVSVPLPGVTVHVSFNQPFTNPPQVLVSPLAGPIGGEKYVPAVISNVTTTGFDVAFEALCCDTQATGSSSFTYWAFGN